jgi:glutaredoxin
MADAAPVLYTQTGCAESARVRTWLAERGVPVVEHNVTGNLTAARALAATGVFATPLLIVGRRRVLGYRPAALQAALRDESSAE